jgi:ketosteroid isomerase-like protein
MNTQEYEKKLKMLEKTLEEQQKQIKKFQDIQELQELHTNYAYLLLARDWEKIADLFSDDAVAILHKRGRFQGKAAITDIFKNVVRNNSRGKGRDSHVAAQPVIHVDGDKAAAQWLMFVISTDPASGVESIIQHGRHEMEYARVDGKWKIKYMLFTSPWPREAWSNPTLEQLAQWEKEDKHPYENSSNFPDSF